MTLKEAWTTSLWASVCVLLCVRLSVKWSMTWTYQCIDKPAAEPSKITTMIEYFVITTPTPSLIINDDLEPECAVFMETEKCFLKLRVNKLITVDFVVKKNMSNLLNNKLERISMDEMFLTIFYSASKAVSAEKKLSIDGEGRFVYRNNESHNIFFNIFKILYCNTGDMGTQRFKRVSLNWGPEFTPSYHQLSALQKSLNYCTQTSTSCRSAAPWMTLTSNLPVEVAREKTISPQGSIKYHSIVWRRTRFV